MKKILFGIAIIAVVFVSFIPAPTPSTNWRGVSDYLKDVSNVTQASSITTAVEITGRTGVITTVSSTLAVDSQAVFRVNWDHETDTTITSTSQISLTPQYAGNVGQVVADVRSINDTSFEARITNVGTGALGAVVKLHYEIRN